MPKFYNYKGNICPILLLFIGEPMPNFTIMELTQIGRQSIEKAMPNFIIIELRIGREFARFSSSNSVVLIANSNLWCPGVKDL